MGNGHTQGTPKGLEQGLGNMVAVTPTQGVHVKGCPGMVDEALKKLKDELGIEPTNGTCGDIPCLLLITR